MTCLLILAGLLIFSRLSRGDKIKSRSRCGMFYLDESSGQYCTAKKTNSHKDDTITLW